MHRGKIKVYIDTRVSTAMQIDSGYYERLVLSSEKAPSALESREMSGMIIPISA